MITESLEYHLTDQLHESPDSLVYRARHKQTGEQVVLKMLKPADPSPEQTAEFRREYDCLRALSLMGVIKAHGFRYERERWVMILEDFGGESLARLHLAGRLSVVDFLRLTINLTETLDQLHKQHLIHRDLNPTNIVFNPNTGQVKIIDFGLALKLPCERASVTQAHRLEGTPAYLAPEQTGRTAHVIDYRTDFYALGATFYELLTGRLPFAETDTLALVHSHLAKSPPHPSRYKADLPESLSNIVLKLMAKNVEDRYQSAAGLKADLEECLWQWQATQRIDPFPLGRKDIPHDLNIATTLYGRQPELGRLRAAFERVSAPPLWRKKEAAPEAKRRTDVVWVSGPAGVGKSTLVHALAGFVRRNRGYFISGVFEPLQPHLPYAAFIQAFRMLGHRLLIENDNRLAVWREKLWQALGENGGVLTEMIPELELLIGPQPDLTDLPSAERQHRFNLTLQQFVQVFAQADHPLVIFLDDLQWADDASLKLIERLLTFNTETQHLYFIGAYRDNEIDDAHPLSQTLARLDQEKGPQQHIKLKPLSVAALSEWLAESLQDEPRRTTPLAELIEAKTGGNPFFVKLFLESLDREKLLTFYKQRSGWQWNLDDIRRQEITDNVVDFMADRIRGLQTKTQATLEMAACLGHHFDLTTLAIARDQPLSQTAINLWEAVTEGLIVPLTDSHRLATLDNDTAPQAVQIEYKFVHERIRQAVYALIPPPERPVIHHRLGQRLLKQLPAEPREAHIFDIVNHLNLGQAALETGPEREEVAALNLVAGQQAKAANAYDTALSYFQSGLNLLSEDAWERQYSLTLELHLGAVEAACLSGQFPLIQGWAQTVLKKATSTLDQVKIYEVEIQAYIAQHRLYEAFYTAKSALHLLGVRLPEQPGKRHRLLAEAQTKFHLIGKYPEDLYHLPPMTDAHKQAAMRVMMRMMAPTFLAAPEFMPLLVCKMVNLSVQAGNAPESALAYALYGVILTTSQGNMELGYQFGQLGQWLVEKFEAETLRAKVLFGITLFIDPWRRSLRETVPDLLEIHKMGLKYGDLGYAALAAMAYTTLSLFVGRHLAEVETEIDQFGRMIDQLNYETAHYSNEVGRQFTLMLMGQITPPHRREPSSIADGSLLSVRFATNDQAIFLLYFFNGLLFYLFEAYPQAAANFEKAEHYLTEMALGGGPLLMIFYSLRSLVDLARYAQANASERRRILRQVERHQKTLGQWAKQRPDNYEAFYHLVEAELAWVQERPTAAERAYQQALDSTKQSQAVNQMAFIHERLGRFHLARGAETIAREHLLAARRAYRRWGAQAKVNHLDQQYPHHFNRPPADPLDPTDVPKGTPPSLNTQRHTTAVLDAATLHKTLLPDTLSETGRAHLESLLTTAIENSGAQKGCVIIKQDKQRLVMAAAIVRDEQVVLQDVEQRQQMAFPNSLVRYAERTGAWLTLPGTASAAPFKDDPYLIINQPQSLLIAPFTDDQAEQAILYLENQLTGHVFTSKRVALLNDLLKQGVNIAKATDLAQTNLAEAPTTAAPTTGQSHQFKEHLLDPTDIPIPDTGETLSPREVEVLHLIAQGATNRAITEALVISMPTVKTHVTHILSKLNVNSRFEAVDRARELGILL